MIEQDEVFQVGNRFIKITVTFNFPNSIEDLHRDLYDVKIFKRETGKWNLISTSEHNKFATSEQIEAVKNKVWNYLKPR